MLCSEIGYRYVSYLYYKLPELGIDFQRLDNCVKITCMNSYDVIVGSNNKTGELETERIIEITSRYYDKYMIISHVISVENCSREELAIVVVTSDENKLIKYCTEVRRELNQHEVAYRQSCEIKSV